MTDLLTYGFKDNNILELLEIGLREKFYKCYNYRYRNMERYRNIHKLTQIPSNIRKYKIIDYDYWDIYESDSDSD